MHSNEAVTLFLLLPPHIIHHSLTVDPPDSLINPKQRLKQKSTKVRQKLPLSSVHPLALSLWNFSFSGTGGGGNLSWGAQNEVHCSHKIICLAQACSSVCGFWNSDQRELSEGTVSELDVNMWWWKLQSLMFKPKTFGQTGCVFLRCKGCICTKSFTLMEDMHQYRLCFLSQYQ